MKITHQGQPVQFGGEKEFNLKSMGGDSSYLQHTRQPDRWQPNLLGNVSADMVKPGVKVDGPVQWTDLNDKGKAQYAIAYKAQNGKFPVIRTNPNPDYSKIAWEKNGWIEVVSEPFDLQGIQNFLNDYGWGHVHTSFMRGAQPAEQKQMMTWVGNANMYSFLNALENRNFKVNGDEGWRFCIKGLSIPTAEHLGRWSEILAGKNRAATAYSKHTLLNVRGNGKQYGHRDRIGMEMRGGSKDEKRRILNSQLHGLQGNGWGAMPDNGGFSMPSVPPAELTKSRKGGFIQVKKLPRQFKALMQAHLRDNPIDGMSAADTDRIFAFVDSARFFDHDKSARLEQFDHRACVPLLAYEKLPWLDDAAKGRAVKARTWFMQQMNELSKNNGMSARDKAVKSAQIMTDWAKQAKLADAFGKWIDGKDGPQNYLR